MNYPIMIDLKDKEVTIIGGGKIAYRKANNFIEFGCNVRLVSLDFIDIFKNMSDNIKLIRDEYSEEYIQNSFIVVAATNDKDINEKIGIYCNNNNKLVNVVDNPKLSSFIVPACIKRGDLVIGVSTSGKSPSLASKIKKELENKYDNSYEEYLNLLGELRLEILAKYKNPEDKKRKLNSLIDLTIEELRIYKV